MRSVHGWIDPKRKDELSPGRVAGQEVRVGLGTCKEDVEGVVAGGTEGEREADDGEVEVIFGFFWREGG